jgi:hypothetical protein
MAVDIKNQVKGKRLGGRLLARVDAVKEQRALERDVLRDNTVRRLAKGNVKMQLGAYLGTEEHRAQAAQLEALRPSAMTAKKPRTRWFSLKK